jgi:hypothetical protein
MRFMQRCNAALHVAMHTRGLTFGLEREEPLFAANGGMKGASP